MSQYLLKKSSNNETQRRRVQPSRSCTSKSGKGAPSRDRKALGDITNRNRKQQQQQQRKQSKTTKIVVKKPGPVRKKNAGLKRKQPPLKYLTLAKAAKETVDAPDGNSSSSQAVPMDTASDEPRIYKSQQLSNVPPAPCDIADSTKPEWVAEYVADVFAYQQEIEERDMVPDKYMSKQQDINEKMRAILIDWLVEVHEKFKLKSETLFLTVNIVDRFLQTEQVSRSKLQLVGCTAMFLASKYEEIYAPEVRDFTYISDQACQRQSILEMEGVMLSALEYRVTTPSSRLFAERYYHVSGCSDKVWQLCQCILELALVDMSMLALRPSLIAASALYIAMRFVTGANWSEHLTNHTGYTEDKLEWKKLYFMILNPHPKERAVRKKYGSKKNGEVIQYIICAKEKHERKLKNQASS